MDERYGRIAPPVESIPSPPKPTPVQERGFNLEQQLREGKYYTNIKLEGYMAENPWPREIVARDILQNFFDANGFTLDGIEIDIQEEGEKTVVTVRGAKSYPYQRLVSFGSGQKDDPIRSAGGKHQGTKDVVAMLLREYGCEGVSYGADDWELTFFKDELPAALQEHKEETEEKEHGVFLHLKDHEPVPGNFLRFETTDREMAESLVKARELFFHASNPDFQNPDFVSDQAGLRILKPGEKGNFYLNGQRISFEKRGTWQTLPGFTFWSAVTPEYNGQKISLGRDRDMISEIDVRHIFLPFLVESMSPEEQELVLIVLDDYFSSDQNYEPDKIIGRAFVQWLAENLSQVGKKISFSPRDIADDLDNNSSMRAALKDQGYRLCLKVLADVGMPRAGEILARIEIEHELKPTEPESKRMELLKDAVAPFLAASHKRLKLQPKPIKLFAGLHPALEAQYAGDFVWMERRTVHRERPHETLATYFHELCHEVGGDESAAFSYKLTDLLAEWTEYLADHPGALKEFEHLWNEHPTGPDELTLEDILAEAESLIAQEHHGRYHGYTPEQLDVMDREVNRASELVLDALLAQPSAEVSSHSLFDLWEAVGADPLTKKLKRIRQSMLLSDEERHVIEGEKLYVLNQMDQRFHESTVISAKLKEMEKGKTTVKRGRMKLKKDYEHQLAQIEVYENLLQKELSVLREQLPERWDFVRPGTLISVFGKSFDAQEITDPTFFFRAGLRALHAQAPLAQMDAIAMKHLQDEWQSVLDRLIKSCVEDESFHNPYRTKRILVMELDIHLAYTKKFPVPTNILLGKLLVETIRQL